MALRLTVASVLLLILAGCAQAQNSPTDAEDRERSYWTQHERTAHDAQTNDGNKVLPGRPALTGVITDAGKGLHLNRKKAGRWILVEENPNADCRGSKGPLKPGCGKMYFDITRTTDVYQEQGNSLAKVPAARLKKGQKVRADYSGYDVATSYPEQTSARIVAILEPPNRR